MLNQNDADFIKKFGRHASSLITLLPHFKSFWHQGALIRFYENETVNWGAHGPLNGEQETVKAFFDQAVAKNKLGLLSPVDEALALSFKNQNYNIQKIGVAPIFNLALYFSKTDPLLYLPMARALKKKGAEVVGVRGSECTPELKSKFVELVNQWEQNKNYAFLCRTRPLENFNEKMFFYLKDKGGITALVTALPFSDHKYYLCDYIRGSDSRAGSIEYLLIEAMRYLKGLNISEVHLGLCPLAEVTKPWWIQFIFKRNLFYQFQGIYQFKKKLGPTSWETQYLIANRSFSLIDYKNILETILDYKLLSRLKAKFFNTFTLHKDWDLRPSHETFFKKISLTLSFSAIFILLHYSRTYFPGIENLFKESYFSPQEMTFKGFFFSPLFHNHQFHLWGDQLSFLLLGGIFEYFAGKKITLIIIAAGLWSSNPLTVALLKPILNFFPDALHSLLQEKDYGSSNAVYALAGALAGILRKKYWLFGPFLANAIVLIFLKQSLLAVHHLTGLFLGLGIVLIIQSFKSQKNWTHYIKRSSTKITEVCVKD